MADPKKEKRGGVFRENVEALAVAIVMAVVIKQFAFEAFKVPTESMEPTIIGRAQGGDRIIVNKFVYQIREPRRFEIMVFKYPLNLAVNYVKRVIGLPDEHVEIQNGDILVRKKGEASLSVVRKPDLIQDEIFAQFPLIPADDQATPSAAWRYFREWVEPAADGTDGERGAWSVGQAGITGSASKDAWIGYRRPEEASKLPNINNRRSDPLARTAGGQAPPPEAAEEVGDVRVIVDVKPGSKGGACLMEITDAYHKLPIRLVLAVEGGSEESELSAPEGNAVVKKKLDRKLAADETTRISLSNVDDCVLLEVDGDELLRLVYSHEQPKRDDKGQKKLPNSSAIRLGVRNGKLTFEKIRLERDVFYTDFGSPPETTVFDLGEGDYLCLGDNSANSLDARGWRFAEIRLKETGEVLRGDKEGVTDDESAPRHKSNPWLEPDGRVRFCDILGNIRTLERIDVPSGTLESQIEPVLAGSTFTGSFKVRGETVTPASYEMVTPADDYDHVVRRWQVVGRALGAFWPLNRIGIIR